MSKSNQCTVVSRFLEHSVFEIPDNSNQTGRPFTNQTLKSYPRFFKPPDTLHLVFAFPLVVRKIGIPLETFFSFVISVNNAARIGQCTQSLKYCKRFLSDGCIALPDASHLLHGSATECLAPKYTQILAYKIHKYCLKGFSISMSSNYRSS